MNREEMSALLFEQYDDIIRLLRMMRVAEDDVEDLALDAILEGIRHLGDLRDENKLDRWMRTIAANKARRYFFNRNRRCEVSTIVGSDAGEIDIYDKEADVDTVESLLQTAEEQALVELMLNGLPPLARSIIRMRFWEGYKFEEIARLLDMNANTAKTVYRRSLQQLREMYGRMLCDNDVRTSQK